MFSPSLLSCSSNQQVDTTVLCRVCVCMNACVCGLGERKVLPYILTAFGSCYRNEVRYIPKGPNSHVPCS